MLHVICSIYMSDPMALIFVMNLHAYLHGSTLTHMHTLPNMLVQMYAGIHLLVFNFLASS